MSCDLSDVLVTEFVLLPINFPENGFACININMTIFLLIYRHYTYYI